MTTASARSLAAAFLAGAVSLLVITHGAPAGSGTPFYDLETVHDPAIPGLPSNPTSTHIYGINAAGTIVGFNRYNGTFDRPLTIDEAGVVTALESRPTSYGSAVAINDAGVAVGWRWGSVNPSTTPQAMRWVDPANGEPLTGLGAQSEAWGINAGGVIVGWTEEHGGMQAFVWEDGKAQLLGTLGGATSRAWAINDAGQVVGGAETASGEMHAFLWENGVMTDLGDFSTIGGQGGFARGINDAGVVVGTMFTADGERGFVWANGLAQNLGTLYDHMDSEAWDVNAGGDIVGRMYYPDNPDVLTRAFIWRDGVMYDLVTQVVNIDSTNLEVRHAYDINDAGQMVGRCTYGGNNGFIVTPTKADFDYTVTDLGAPPGGAFNIIPTGLNEQGEAVGWTLTSSQDDPPYNAWKWTPQDGMVLLPQAVPGDTTAAADMNESGQVTGAEVTAFGDGSAWRFDGGGYTFAGLLPGTTWSFATGINAAGDFVGFGDDFTPGPGNTTRFFIYTDGGGLMEIADGPGIITGIGRINDAQVVTGRSSEQAFRWTIAGGMELIPYPGGFSYGYDINESGQVSGIVAIGAEKYGALYTDGIGWQLIANIVAPGGQESPGWEYGLAVNNNGAVVGYSEQDNPSEGYEIGWVWSPEDGLRVLDDVIEPTGLPSWFHLYRAVDITDDGKILAEGTGLNGLLHGAFLLTPVGGKGAVSGDATDDGVVDVGDLVAIIAGWGECADCFATPCAADLNGDCVVNVDDLLLVIIGWS